MKGLIIDCRPIQEGIKEEIRHDIETWGLLPILTIIQVGDNGASNKYINQKIKHGEDVGIKVNLVKLPESTLEREVIEVIRNEQVKTDSIIVQLPLPAHMDEQKVLDAIDPNKDVDCLTSTNQGRLYNGNSPYYPCTPNGIVYIIEKLKPIRGLNILVVGRSNIVGKPLAQMLTNKDATVTVAHSKTKNLDDLLMSGKFDVIVSAIGKPKCLKAKAEILIDVGINKVSDGICGDFDVENCQYDYITPVPNGIGRMTVASLLVNILKSAMV